MVRLWRTGRRKYGILHNMRASTANTDPANTAPFELLRNPVAATPSSRSLPLTNLCNICRRLANRERLNLLRKVMTSPERDGLSALHLADMTWLNPATARVHLRVLTDECGLVESVRSGRFVTFRTRRAPGDATLRRLVPALVAFFRAEGRGGCDVNGAKAPDPAFARLLRPLSDVSRVRLLCAIRDEGPLMASELRSRCGLSAEEVTRHLKVLSGAGLVAEKDRGVTFAEPFDPLSCLFVSLAFDAT